MLQFSLSESHRQIRANWSVNEQLQQFFFFPLRVIKAALVCWRLPSASRPKQPAARVIAYFTHSSSKTRAPKFNTSPLDQSDDRTNKIREEGERQQGGKEGENN